MTVLWRISNFEDLNGLGGLHVEGRWHPVGNKIVYLSEHPALALLEVLVNLEIDREDLPETFKLLKISVPDGIRDFEDAQIKTNWKNNISVTQNIGFSWLNAGNTPFLRVPSAILPESTNMLLNPNHKEASKVRIVDVIPFPFDERLAD